MDMTFSRASGTEEYASNEKYEVRGWGRQEEGSLREVIALVNEIRRRHPALHDHLITLQSVDNEQLLAFSKRGVDASSVVLVVINLDVHHTQAGFLNLDLAALGIGNDEPFQLNDLLTDERYRWQGPRAYVQLDPAIMPGAIFVIRRRVRERTRLRLFSLTRKENSRARS